MAHPDDNVADGVIIFDDTEGTREVAIGWPITDLTYYDDSEPSLATVPRPYIHLDGGGDANRFYCADGDAVWIYYQNRCVLYKNNTDAVSFVGTLQGGLTNLFDDNVATFRVWLTCDGAGNLYSRGDSYASSGSSFDNMVDIKRINTSGSQLIEQFNVMDATWPASAPAPDDDEVHVVWVEWNLWPQSDGLVLCGEVAFSDSATPVSPHLIPRYYFICPVSSSLVPGTVSLASDRGINRLYPEFPKGSGVVAHIEDFPDTYSAHIDTDGTVGTTVDPAIDPTDLECEPWIYAQTGKSSWTLTNGKALGPIDGAAGSLTRFDWNSLTYDTPAGFASMLGSFKVCSPSGDRIATLDLSGSPTVWRVYDGDGNLLLAAEHNRGELTPQWPCAAYEAWQHTTDNRNTVYDVNHWGIGDEGVQKISLDSILTCRKLTKSRKQYPTGTNPGRHHFTRGWQAHWTYSSW